MAIVKTDTSHLSSTSTPLTGPVMMMYALMNLDGTADFASGCSIGDLSSSNDHFVLATDEISGVFHAECVAVDVGSATAQSTTSVAKDIWISVVAVFNAVNNRDVYLNGTGSASNFTVKTPDNIDIIRIGSSAGSGTTFDGPCRIAEVAMWNTNLSSGQAIIVGQGPPFISPLAFKPQNLVFYNPLWTAAQGLTPMIGPAMTKTGDVDDYPHPPVLYPHWFLQSMRSAGAPPAGFPHGWPPYHGNIQRAFEEVIG